MSISGTKMGVSGCKMGISSCKVGIRGCKKVFPALKWGISGTQMGISNLFWGTFKQHNGTVLYCSFEAGCRCVVREDEAEGKRRAHLDATILRSDQSRGYHRDATIPRCCHTEMGGERFPVAG